MKYTVLWTGVAEDRLAGLWIDAPDRTLIALAADTIDRLLSEDPHQQGESREGNTRITFCYPLAVEFEVVEEDRTVFVLAVWSYAKT
jgi:hypothetical protein